tara:strand:+ start:400 stop:648 length:249 start_codon:yes stop_codon:yes gene_type:complete
MYPIGSESWSMTMEKDMIAYVNKYNYMVIFPDRKVELFKSLRDIQNSISIDSSTISKKLKNDEHIFTAKGSEYIFYIEVIGK